MFNYNLNQNNANPNQNNYCGGYALAAVLNAVNNLQLNMPNPQNIYAAIQVNQAGLVGPNSQGLINGTQAGGTDICLPSSIAMTARQYRLTPTVLYGNPPFPAPVIQEELNRLQMQNIAVQQNNVALAQLLLARTENYFIVLVDNGQHWVAVEKLNNNFTVYDPGTGVITPNLQGLTYSSLVIALR